MCEAHTAALYYAVQQNGMKQNRIEQSRAEQYGTERSRMWYSSNNRQVTCLYISRNEYTAQAVLYLSGMTANHILRLNTLMHSRL